MSESPTPLHPDRWPAGVAPAGLGMPGGAGDGADGNGMVVEGRAPRIERAAWGRDMLNGLTGRFNDAQGAFSAAPTAWATVLAAAVKTCSEGKSGRMRAHMGDRLDRAANRRSARAEGHHRGIPADVSETARPCSTGTNGERASFADRAPAAWRAGPRPSGHRIALGSVVP